VQSQGYAGLAAVALARGDYQQALNLVNQVEALAPEVVFSHIIRGHILFNQRKLAEAITTYRTAMEKTQDAPWQRAIVYNRLGQISVAQGNTKEALEYYNKAIEEHQDIAVFFTNKGHLLEKLDNRKEALTLYRQALQHNPEDRLTRALLREAERREQFAQDAMKQERIDQLVVELVRFHKEGKKQPSVDDGWTSIPLTLAIFNFQLHGPLSPRAGEEEFLMLKLGEALQRTGRITIVEREILDKLLAEVYLPQVWSEVSPPSYIAMDRYSVNTSISFSIGSGS
jgi:tetratricopeptide (TPR) repeat protein